jgi:hypothetical protein
MRLLTADIYVLLYSGAITGSGPGLNEAQLCPYLE